MSLAGADTTDLTALSAQQLAMLAGAVREQLWTPGEMVEIAYIGGAFQSQVLLDNFRSLTELHDGVRTGPPWHGPAEGALREAYRLVGLDRWAEELAP